MRTASNLLAPPLDDGVPCFYCGAIADRPLRLSSTFGDWADIASPASRAVCDGCHLSLCETIAIPGKAKPQKTRNYSWLVTATEATPLHKGQIDVIRAACLDPPSPPWALAIAMSGQKQLLWRTPVNRQPSPCVVMLETQAVRYDPAELAARLERSTLVAAAIGKPVLTEPLDVRFYSALVDEYGDDRAAFAAEWFDDNASPLGALAAFLTPSRKDARVALDS